MAVSPAREIIRFGLFELDLAGQLTRQGAKLRLPQQPLQLLAVLLERPGEIFTRDELRQRLWPSDVFVDFDHGLNKSIQKLRDALGDSAASPRYIETLPRVGYRFIAPVSNGTKPAPMVVEPLPPLPASQPKSGVDSPKPRWWILAAAGAAVVCAAAGVYLSSRPHPRIERYTRLTDFTDSTSSPALSHDGKMLAFLRSADTFMSSDPIYVKLLPNGEPTLVTSDARLKYGLAFSPDGSQIAYTVIQDQSFATQTISALGGDPHLLLKNAAGLTWLDPEHVLFSRIRSGLHLGVVTATVNGDGAHDLYYPAHERAMDHYSYASPDRAWALVVEMAGDGTWDQCRLISLEATAAPRPAGPLGGCTSAGWSPDGAWMYFIAYVDGQSHLWRQRFPDGQPQQITFGPTEEQGLAVESSGNSVITGMGVQESALWIHDDRGDRPLSSEGEIIGYMSPPLFTSDDQFLYYLTLHQATDSGAELWRLPVATGKGEPVLPGVHMKEYDVSADGKQVVYSTTGQNGNTQLWIAPVDRSAPPKPIGSGNERWPHFGPDGEIVFQAIEGSADYLERVNADGRDRVKVIPYSIIDIQSVSPGRTWLAAVVIYPHDGTSVPIMAAIPLRGGAPRRLCQSVCAVRWASSGRFVYITVEAATQKSPGRNLAIPLGPEESLPALPAEGIRSDADPSVVAGAQSVNRQELVGGKDPEHYAYVKPPCTATFIGCLSLEGL